MFAPLPARGQLPVSLLNEATEIRSIHFRFQDTDSFAESRLRDVIGLSAQGAGHGFRKAISFLPFVGEPDPHLFDPLSLQRDVARLRVFYRTAGFPDAHVRYDVTLDEGRNVVDVTFLVSEGQPTTLSSVAWIGPDGGPFEDGLPPELVQPWRTFVERERGLGGVRFGEGVRVRVEESVASWLADRGYPFPTVVPRLEPDSTGVRGRLTVQIDPGPRSRVGDIAVEGAESVADHVFLREVSLGRGDWYSASRVSQGRRRIVALPIVSAAVPEVVAPEEPDSTISILFRIREARQRRMSGYVGYSNVAGVSLGGEWSHRNFAGGARTLTVSGASETGVAAVFTGVPDIYARAAVSLRQPFVLVPGLSLVASPFGEYRNDYRDRSWEAGMDGTLVYQYAPLRAVSLRYRVSHREVLDYAVAGTNPTVPLLGGSYVLDRLADNLTIAALTLSASMGTTSDPAGPPNGYTFQPSLEVTVPPALPSNNYVKADVWGSAFRSLGRRMRLAASVRAGRVFPFGRSVPPPGEDGLAEFLQLRDVALTAGGPADVRGWGSRLLGPKVPDVLVTASDSSETVYSATRYLPVGGLARVTGSVDLQVPLAGLDPRVAGHVFLDGGRVWTPDDRYAPHEDLLDQEKSVFSAGVGIGVDTPVGPIRVNVAYKLNPAPLDLRDPGAVLALILEGRSPLEAPIRQRRRFQVHLTMGRVF